ncbi:hypothetical protein WICPIJ_008380 [Wickerhamomyces pijperi]|uniref:Uncharacterized protein n=1 Tax=Wickerhamomyces pijperi TaxID=599730 RepID=A0A9P8PXU2_WICPI|nr:hypothetical protein WICPIJ_008380 [Wickerhamomyces pijperi]
MRNNLQDINLTRGNQGNGIDIITMTVSEIPLDGQFLLNDFSQGIINIILTHTDMNNMATGMTDINTVSDTDLRPRTFNHDVW